MKQVVVGWVMAIASVLAFVGFDLPMDLVQSLAEQLATAIQVGADSAFALWNLVVGTALILANKISRVIDLVMDKVKSIF